MHFSAFITVKPYCACITGACITGLTDVLTKHRNVLLLWILLSQHRTFQDCGHFYPIVSYTDPTHWMPTNTGRHNIYITDYGDFIVSRFNYILYIHGSVWCQSLSYTHTFTSYACTKVKFGTCLVDFFPQNQGRTFFIGLQSEIGWPKRKKNYLLNIIFFIFLARHLKKLLWMSKIKNIVYFLSWPKENKTPLFWQSFIPKCLLSSTLSVSFML